MAKPYSQLSYSLPDDPEDSAADTTADPFAIDLFGSVSDPSDAALSFVAETEEPVAETPWHASLPRISRAEATLSASVSPLLEAFTRPPLRPLAEALARFTHSSQEEAHISILEFREERWTPPNADTFLYVRFSVGPDRLPLVAYLDVFLAIRLIDRALGGAEEPLATLRTLTVAELAVIEFIGIAFAQAFNQSIPLPALRLEACGHCPLPDAPPEGAARTLTLNALLQFRDTSGVVTLHFPAAALTPLSAASGDAGRPKLAESEAFRRLSHRLDAAAHLVVGTTEATLEQLRHLEPDDVFVIERRTVAWREAHLSGELHLRVGEGDFTVVTGVATATEAPTVHMTVEHISLGHEPTELERWSMYDANDNPPAEGADALDGLVLTVHAEFPARRIRLDELARLRAGQILDLGCTATDLVYLTCDGRPIARGELVDIEGHLGVRILQLMS
jgi:type III secretion system YscQ/HrcQ family protein